MCRVPDLPLVVFWGPRRETDKAAAEQNVALPRSHLLDTACAGPKRTPTSRHQIRHPRPRRKAPLALRFTSLPPPPSSAPSARSRWFDGADTGTVWSWKESKEVEEPWKRERVWNLRLSQIVGAEKARWAPPPPSSQYAPMRHSKTPGCQ